MKVKYQSTGESFFIDAGLRIGGGGEGTVYGVPGNPALAAKIFTRNEKNNLRSRKLQIMLDQAPLDPTRRLGHISIAWPVDILLSADNGMVVGYVMPCIEKTLPISNYYDVALRHLKCPLFRYDYLCRTATNLASAVRALHESGCVIGDVNESNILVTETAMVTLIDTDSFQVIDPDDGAVYRCPVCTAAFTPPELQNRDLSQINRSPDHDMFGITVLFFQLLMEGTRPFAGIFPGDPPDYEMSILKGYFPYGRHPKNSPPKTAPPFDILPSRLQELFVQCFEEGHKNPVLRPDAQTWLSALRDSERGLIVCAVNDQHRYFGHRKECPWCERAARFQSPRLPGWDPFPLKERARDFMQYDAFSKPKPLASQFPISSTTPASVFQATPASIVIGESVTLQWYVPNAQIVTIKANNRRIIKSGSNQGSIAVYPVRDTIYGIRARGANLCTPPSLRVAVSVPPTPSLLNQAGLLLNQNLLLRDIFIKLLPMLWLKYEIVRLYAIVRMKGPADLNSFIKLNQISMALMTSPYRRPAQPAGSGTRKNGRWRTILNNVKRFIGRQTLF